MLLLRGVKDRSGKLRIERKCEHAFERVSAAVPEFTAVRKLLDFGGDQPQPPGLGYALNHRGSLRRSRNAIFAIARWRRRNTPPSTDVIGRLLLTFTRMADHIAKSQSMEPLTAGNVE
jgi:hypothetical protein